jgi:hypothetical protein
MHDYEDALREVLNRVYRNTDDCEMRISKDCYKLIREALEKQIPKMPINEECYYICPCCRGDLGVSDDDIFIYELLMPKYCSNCGCALDWTEVKNESLFG